MQRKLTVSQLNKYIAGVFDDEEVLHSITVCGEVFENKRSGNCTFITLKEDDCTLQCVCFFAVDFIKIGDNVEATGSVKYYAKSGRTSFMISAITPAGEGILALEFLKLKEKLKGEGLFENRPPLPERVNKIAVITSATGAVLHDIVSVVRKKNPFLDVCVYDVRVQGTDSANLIAEALGDVNTLKDIDVIIVARGGGSASDLSAYNTEIVARAVAMSKIPVVSAVGHETDYTLCDLCASARAGTPSIAADMVTEPILSKIERLRGLALVVSNCVENKFIRIKQLLLMKCFALTSAEENAVIRRENEVGALLERIEAQIDGELNKRETRLNMYTGMLDKLSPLKVLSRGYAKVSKNHKDVTSVKDVSSGEVISVRLMDGKFDATVK